MSDRSKIIGINDAKNGMQFLAEQAHPQASPRGHPAAPPENKCLKIRVILDATDYYAPLDGFCMNGQPPFQFQLPVAYSVVPAPAGGIMRHETMEIFATGLRTEIVDLPGWWSLRDNGVI